MTVGVCQAPQPNVELAVADPRPLRRVELGALLPSAWSEEQLQRFAAYLSGQAKLPWARFTWLGDQHTLPCDVWRSPQFSAAMLLRTFPGLPNVPLPDFDGDPVSLLWFVPITAAERDRATASGSRGVVDALPRDRLGLA